MIIVNPDKLINLILFHINHNYNSILIFKADLRDLFAECLHRMNIILNPIHSQTDPDHHHHHHHRRRHRSHFITVNQSRINNDKNGKNHYDDDDDGAIQQQLKQSDRKNESNCQLQLTELHKQQHDLDNNDGHDVEGLNHRSRLLYNHHYYNQKIIKTKQSQTIIINDQDDNNDNNEMKMMKIPTKMFKKTIVSDHSMATIKTGKWKHF